MGSCITQSTVYRKFRNPQAEQRKVYGYILTIIIKYIVFNIKILNLIIITECTLFLQKDMKEKIFIPISKTFSVSQRDVGSSSAKNKYNAAVSIANSKRNHIEVQLENHDKIELPNTNQVRHFFLILQ